MGLTMRPWWSWSCGPVGADARAEQLVDVEACEEAMIEQVGAAKAALGQEVSMLEVQDVEDTIPVIKAAVEQQMRVAISMWKSRHAAQR